MNTRYTQQSFRGLTFIEMLVTITIFSLAMVLIVESVLMFYRANTSSIEQSVQVNSAHRGALLLVQNIREATFADDGSYPLAHIGTSTVTFFSDVTRNGAAERVTYTLDDTTLTRAVVSPSGSPAVYEGAGDVSVVSTYVRNNEEEVPLFRYFDIHGNEILDFDAVGAVRSVTIDLVVNIQPTRAPNEFMLRSSATLRNLKSE